MTEDLSLATGDRDGESLSCVSTCHTGPMFSTCFFQTVSVSVLYVSTLADTDTAARVK